MQKKSLDLCSSRYNLNCFLLFRYRMGVLTNKLFSRSPWRWRSSSKLQSGHDLVRHGGSQPPGRHSWGRWPSHDGILAAQYAKILEWKSFQISHKWTSPLGRWIAKCKAWQIKELYIISITSSWLLITKYAHFVTRYGYYKLKDVQ